MRTLTRRQEQIIERIPEKVQKYLELKAQMDNLKKQIEELKNELLTNIDRLRVKSLEIELNQEFKVKIAKVEYTYEQVDKKALKEKYPEIYQEVKVEKDILRLDIRKVKNRENNQIQTNLRVGPVVSMNK